ncbi:MAG: GntR family transcriptional regulator [Massilia sp.]|nr:GntR family transcriptional regulator [Massilia sp.]
MKTPIPFQLDPAEATPLYLQISRHLSEAVRAGKYRVNDALPSERALAEGLAVSRVTARKALAHLAANGMVHRVRGSGNYIAPLEMPMSRLSGFSEDLTRRGYQPSSRWLSRTLDKTHVDEQMALGLSSGEKVARLERIRMHDDVAVSYELSVVPAKYIPQPLDIVDSMYKYLAQSGHRPVRALQHFKAVNASADVAGKLGVPLGHALFYIRRVGYLQGGAAVELTSSYCLSEYFDFVAEMTRENDAENHADDGENP